MTMRYPQQHSVFFKEEYEAIKREMLSRINMLNTHNMTMVTIVVALWVLGCTILGVVSKISEPRMEILTLCAILTGVVFCVPNLIVCSLAIRYEDNLLGIYSLAMYVCVVIELPAQLDCLDENNPNRVFVGWESRRQALRPDIVNRFNLEYIALSLAAFVILISYSICCLIYLWGQIVTVVFVILVLMCVVMTAISLYATIKVYIRIKGLNFLAERTTKRGKENKKLYDSMVEKYQNIVIRYHIVNGCNEAVFRNMVNNMLAELNGK